MHFVLEYGLNRSVDTLEFLTTLPGRKSMLWQITFGALRVPKRSPERLPITKLLRHLERPLNKSKEVEMVRVRVLEKVFLY